MKFKRILCGVDFSHTSVQAFETAVDLARFFNAELHVIHVVEAEPSVPDFSLEEKALAAMDTLTARAVKDGRDLQITTEVTTGSASTEILNRAHERNVDLIALGTKGLTLLEEGIVGGVAKRVFSGAPCSVLAVAEASRP